MLNDSVLLVFLYVFSLRLEIDKKGQISENHYRNPKLFYFSIRNHPKP